MHFLIEKRPWGEYEVLYRDETIQVKRIKVHPHHQTSLQSHQYRSEHWIILQGTATVTIDDNHQSLHENEACFIPAGTIHRLSNQGEEPLVIMEVQTGTYFGEDDILRFQDDYGRG